MCFCRRPPGGVTGLEAPTSFKWESKPTAAFIELNNAQSPCNNRIRSDQITLALTRMVSWVGMCPGPPPVFSGLKLDVGLHKKLGFRMYPQRPLGRKRPWFRSICSPGVWKFRATAETTESIKPPAWMHAARHKTFQSVKQQAMRWTCSGAMAVCSAIVCVCLSARAWSTNPSGSLRSTFPADHSWMIGGAGQRGRSGSAVCCCVSQRASLQMKR